MPDGNTKEFTFDDHVSLRTTKTYNLILMIICVILAFALLFSIIGNINKSDKIIKYETIMNERNIKVK